MANATQVVGIDPGQVHTGIVSMYFDPDTRSVGIKTLVVDGLNTAKIAYKTGTLRTGAEWHCFIEDYRARSHYGADAQMVVAVRELTKKIPGSKRINNTGVKKIVRRPLMELLSVWNFPTITHHQDLRSAARIALFGMLKDDELNALLTNIVRSRQEGRPWTINA